MCAKRNLYKEAGLGCSYRTAHILSLCLFYSSLNERMVIQLHSSQLKNTFLLNHLTSLFSPCTVLISIKRSSRATLSVWQLSLEASGTPDIERGHWPPTLLLVLVKCQIFTFKVCFIRSSLGFLSIALLHSHFWTFLPAFYDVRELWMPLHGFWKAWVLYECVYILPSFSATCSRAGEKEKSSL